MREFEILPEEKQMEAMAREYAKIKRMRVLPKKRTFYVAKLPEKKIPKKEGIENLKTKYLLSDVCCLSKKLSLLCANFAMRSMGEAKRYAHFASLLSEAAASTLSMGYYDLYGEKPGDPSPFLYAPALKNAGFETQTCALSTLEKLCYLEKELPFCRDAAFTLLKADRFLSFACRLLHIY